MRGFLIAAVVSLLYAVIVLLVFRCSRAEHWAAMMLKIYFGSLPLLLLLLVFVPVDFSVLPDALVERDPLLDTGFAIFAYSASVFGGWLQLYNLADRGLSLRILIDVLESAPRAISAERLARDYGQGNGICWMYDKRLADIARLGLVTYDHDDLVLTEKGERNARLINRLRSWYALEYTREIN